MTTPLKLRIEDDDGKATVVPLVLDEISIGRKEGNTIRLTERNVSRQHAKFLRQNGTVFVEDLDSYNGVHLNGERIEGRVSVRPGDLVRIGDYHLALQAVEDALDGRGSLAETTQRGAPVPDLRETSAAASAARAEMKARHGDDADSDRDDRTPGPMTAPNVSNFPASTSEPHEGTAVIRASDLRGSTAVGGAPAVDVPRDHVCRLLVVGEHFTGRVFEVSRSPLILGRTDENDICLDHRSVSRNHARIEFGDGVWRVSDMGSANGILVNGEEYATTQLRPGDVLELGYVRLRFVGPKEDMTALKAELAKGGGRKRRRGGRGAPMWAALVLVVAGGLGGAAYWLSANRATDTPPTVAAPAKAPTGSVEAALAEARRLVRGEQWPEARAALEPVLAKPEGNSEAQTIEAQKLADLVKFEAEEKKKIDEGEEAAKKGDWDTAWDRFSSVEEKSGYYPRAVKRLPDIKAAYIGDHLKRAKDAEAAGKLRQALEEFNNVLFLDDRNKDALDGKARIEAALKVARKKGPDEPDGSDDTRADPPSIAAGASGGAGSGPVSPAAAAAPTAPAVAPGVAPAAAPRSPGDKAKAFFNEGNSFILKNRFDDAIARYQSAIKVDPTFAPAYRALGIAFAKMGEPDRAATQYERYLQLAPDSPERPQIQRLLDEYYRSRGKQ